jgi:hypothetical protein
LCYTSRLFCGLMHPIAQNLRTKRMNMHNLCAILGACLSGFGALQNAVGAFVFNSGYSCSWKFL